MQELIIVQWQTARLDDATAFYRDVVGPALKTQPGFSSTRFLLDRATGKGLMVTVWATEADLKASETNGFLKEQIGKLSQFFAAPPSIDRYEIEVSL